MTDPTEAEKLAAIEREWKARQAVERAHASFHIRPSTVAADRLSVAIDEWRDTFATPEPAAPDPRFAETDLAPRLDAAKEAVRAAAAEHIEGAAALRAHEGLQVYQAWNDAGPAPAVHERAKNALRASWPVLANALDHYNLPAIETTSPTIQSTARDVELAIACADTLELEADRISEYTLDLSTSEATVLNIVRLIRRDAKLLRGEQ